jgi:type II restriction enzyme
VAFLLAAAGMSQKSLSHIPKDIQLELISRTIDLNRLVDSSYQDELIRRALLTHGDSLGGEMRNVVGQRAQQLLSDAILNALEQSGLKPQAKRSKQGKISTIDWPGRQIVFDKRPRFIDKSIDLILLNDPSGIEKPSAFLACGELKGGIDPAGADEHWKTACSAFERIRDAFSGRGFSSPKLFFIGSAIEDAMAKEIFDQLSDGSLEAAANLNYSNQLIEAIGKLISL